MKSDKTLETGSPRRNDDPPCDLLIVGASVRAAAGSARRAGWLAWGSDLFGDIDLRAIAKFHPLTGAYPESLREFLCSAPAAPWMYTGALENHPTLVDEVARVRPLWGNGGTALRAVRDPFRLCDRLRREGFRFPASRPANPGVPPRGWLSKLYRSAGGHGITTEATNSADLDLRYHQKQLVGTSYSAVFIADGKECELFGTTEQLVGLSWLYANPFAWCGNIGPAPLRPHVKHELQALGRCVAESFDLRGLFGVDCIVDAQERVWLLEVNPRYTASVEVLELALQRSVLRRHARVFSETLPQREKPRAGSQGTSVVGKAVLYAPNDLRVAAELLTSRTPAPYEIPDFADLPQPGQQIAKGAPMLTLFASATTAHECTAVLREKATRILQRRLNRTPE